jgi:hypothetical protein
MWTEESHAADLIFSVVTSPVAQRLLYQAQMHIRNFRNSKGGLQESFETLLYSDFARSQSCHMNEGVFGADIHAAEMESAKIRVLGYLLNTTTAGHKFLRCLVNARAKDREPDWARFRDDLREIPDTYRRTRNFLEHLDEAAAKEELQDPEDCGFSRHGILHFSDKDGPLEFDFTEGGLAPIEPLWHKLLNMLEERREAGKGTV